MSVRHTSSTSRQCNGPDADADAFTPPQQTVTQCLHWGKSPPLFWGLNMTMAGCSAYTQLSQQSDMKRIKNSVYFKVQTEGLLRGQRMGLSWVEMLGLLYNGEGLEPRCRRGLSPAQHHQAASGSLATTLMGRKGRGELTLQGHQNMHTHTCLHVHICTQSHTLTLLQSRLMLSSVKHEMVKKLG